MEPLALITHITTACSVIILSHFFSKEVTHLSDVIDTKYAKYSLGPVNVLYVLIFSIVFIIVPCGIANFVIYAVDKNVNIKMHPSSALYYGLSFVVSSFQLRLFPFNTVKNV
jgi:hypothetical protein